MKDEDGSWRGISITLWRRIAEDLENLAWTQNDIERVFMHFP